MRKILVGLSAALLLAAVAAPVAATKPLPIQEDSPATDALAGHKVTVCHATSSLKNPYVFVVVDIASSGGLDKVMGHRMHVEELNKKGWADAISAFTYNGDFYEAQSNGDQNFTEFPLPKPCEGEPPVILS